MHAYLFSLNEYTWMHVYVYLETAIMGAWTITYHQMSENVKSISGFKYVFFFMSFIHDGYMTIQFYKRL